ncbi:MAG: hypothetical protein AB4206_03365 [Xenococcaceae cyanobacterium]
MTELNNENISQILSFPELTGNYGVGTTSYHFVDLEREETYTENPNDNREVTAKVWYPSVKLPSSETTPYLTKELGNAIASSLGIPPQDFINVIQSISTNSVADAGVAEAESEYPVLIFSHGFGGLPELNTIKAEELASQGYVVVAINHTYDSLINTFPDGRIITQSSLFTEAENQSELIELLAESINIRSQDAQFVLDQLAEIDAGENPNGLFAGKLDLEQVGMYGYSLGGATTAKVLSLDSRFQAGINLDGGLYGDVANVSLAQPFMFLTTEALGLGNNYEPIDQELSQLQQFFINNLENEAYEVTISGTKHFDFNDLPYLVPLLVSSGIELGGLEESLNLDNSAENFGSIDPQLAGEIINDYTVAFFDQYLNNQESSLLRDNSSSYSEVTVQSYNLNPPEALFGTVEEDILEIDSGNQLIFTGSENDLIDATQSLGNNRIYAGDGDDTIILGTGDRVLAGVGTDRFFSGEAGDNILTGGEGADQFWIAVAQIPNSANVITDFDLQEDIIGIAGVGIGFDELNISQQEDNVLIKANGSDLAILEGITVDSLSIDNFIFA